MCLFVDALIFDENVVGRSSIREKREALDSEHQEIIYSSTDSPAMRPRHAWTEVHHSFREHVRLSG